MKKAIIIFLVLGSLFSKAQNCGYTYFLDTIKVTYTVVEDSTPIPCISIKPPLSGLALRQETWFDSNNPDTAWLNAFGGNIVIRENIKDIWIAHNKMDFSYIDKWVVFAKYWAARGVPIHYKLRTVWGVFCPQWMRNEVGAFPLSSKDYETTPGYDQADDSCVKFWTDAFLNLHKEFIDALAARYDTVECLSEVTVTATTAGTGEPLIFGVGASGSYLTRRNQFVKAGATTENITQAVFRSIDNMNAFKHTNIGLAASPFQQILPTGENTDITKQFDSYLASLYGNRAVLGNNGLQKMTPTGGLDKTWKAPDGKMYVLQQDYIHNRTAFGSTCYSQTGAEGAIGGYGNLITVLDAGVAFKDILIEFPDTEKKIKQVLTNLQLKKYRDLCKANL